MYHYYISSLVQRACALYITYRPYRPGRYGFTVHKAKRFYYTLHLPDRDVLYVPDGVSFAPKPESYDEVVLLNVSRMPWLRRYLFAFPHVLRFFDNYLYLADRKNSEQQVLIDSGGAQIITGAVDYIDPVALVLAARKLRPFATVTLDIPLRDTVDANASLAEACAYTQRRIADRYFKPNKDLGWVAPIQGRKPKYLDRWLQIVWEDWYKGAAVTGATTTIPKIALYVREKTQVDILHILGKGSALSIFLFAWLGRYIPYVSSDSSSPVTAAIYGRVFYTNACGLICDEIPVGTMTSTVPTTSDIELVCQCPACQALKWLGAYSLSCTASSHLLCWHNAYVMCCSADNVARIAANPTTTLDDYLYLAKTLQVTQIEGVRLEHLLRYISLYYEDNPKEANKYYKRFIILAKNSKSARVSMKPSSVWQETVLKSKMPVRTKPSSLLPISCYLSPSELKQFKLDWLNPIKHKAKMYAPLTKRRETWKKLWWGPAKWKS